MTLLKALIFSLLFVIPTSNNKGQVQVIQPSRVYNTIVLFQVPKLDRTQDEITDSLKAVLANASARRTIKLIKVVNKYDELLQENRRLKQELALYKSKEDTTEFNHFELKPTYLYNTDTTYFIDKITLPIKKKNINIIKKIKSIFH